MTDVYLIVDAGGTFLKSALLKKDGTICDASSSSVPSFSVGTEEEVKGAFNQVIEKSRTWCIANQANIRGIGISIPGPFDYHKGVSWMTHKYRCLYGI
ncbi:MAG: ROK family protein, partial [Parabacteroides sp.]